MEQLKNMLFKMNAILNSESELEERRKELKREYGAYISFLNFHSLFKTYFQASKEKLFQHHQCSFDNEKMIRIAKEIDDLISEKFLVRDFYKVVSKLRNNVLYLCLMFSNIDDNNGEKLWYERYCIVMSERESLSKLYNNKITAINSVVEIPYTEYRTISESLKRFREVEDYCQNMGLFLKPIQQYVSLRPFDSDAKRLFIHKRGRRMLGGEKLFRESPYYDRFSKEIGEFKPRMIFREFQEEVANMSKEETERYLKMLKNGNDYYIKAYESLLKDAEKLQEDKVNCKKEIHRVFMECENRPKVLTVKPHGNREKMEVIEGTIVFIKGETFSYSDYEGCTSHIRYEGRVLLNFNEQNELVSFDNISLSIDAEYDGWDDDEVDEGILENLQTSFDYSFV